MLAIPLTKKSSLKNPPVATIAIILVNIFVFAIFQTDDDERHAAAANFYFQSGLYEIEAPLYLDFLKTRRPQAYQEITKQMGADDSAAALGLYHRLEYDTPFMDLLEKGRLPYGDARKKKRHLNLRQEYHNLKKKVVSWYYGFRPARPRL